MTVREGKIQVTGGNLWYRMVGDEGTPLLLLHGGPGYPHECLAPLVNLAAERPVVFYDQLGCGLSDRPEDPSLWTLERFVEEVGEVREELDLETVSILGYSWGTMLAVDYLLTQPGGVDKLILVSPVLSVSRWLEDAKLMPIPIAEGDHVSHEGYESLLASMEAGANQQIYELMWGQNEFEVTGTLKNYERVDRLREIDVPTLFICGRYDVARPRTTSFYQRKMRGAKLRVIENSGHMPFLEAPNAFIAAVKGFLRA